MVDRKLNIKRLHCLFTDSVFSPLRLKKRDCDGAVTCLILCFHSHKTARCIGRARGCSTSHIDFKLRQHYLLVAAVPLVAYWCRHFDNTVAEVGKINLCI